MVLCARPGAFRSGHWYRLAVVKVLRNLLGNLLCAYIQAVDEHHRYNSQTETDQYVSGRDCFQVFIKEEKGSDEGSCIKTDHAISGAAEHNVGENWKIAQKQQQLQQEGPGSDHIIDSDEDNHCAENGTVFRIEKETEETMFDKTVSCEPEASGIVGTVFADSQGKLHQGQAAGNTPDGECDCICHCSKTT